MVILFDDQDKVVEGGFLDRVQAQIDEVPIFFLLFFVFVFIYFIFLNFLWHCRHLARASRN
jgi:hypothetical protein